MGVTSCATLPFPPETHVFSTVFKLLQANSTLFKHLWLVTSIPTSWLELTLVEGKNRQVRRMTAAIGFPTLRLLRARIGNFSLAGLKPGAWKELDSRERRQLMP